MGPSRFSVVLQGFFLWDPVVQLSDLVDFELSAFGF